MAGRVTTLDTLEITGNQHTSSYFLLRRLSVHFVNVNSGLVLGSPPAWNFSSLDCKFEYIDLVEQAFHQLLYTLLFRRLSRHDSVVRLA